MMRVPGPIHQSAALWSGIGLVLTGCASGPDQRTLAELRQVEPDIAEVVIDDSLDKAMDGYRRFLEETPVNPNTPEAMRRLADLQIDG